LNHAFLVVTPEKEGEYYNVSIATKKEVKPCRPFLPKEGRVHKMELANFLLIKSINLERAAFYSSSFSTKSERTFTLSIEDIFKKFLPKK
jgi:hypothetical protein